MEDTQAGPKRRKMLEGHDLIAQVQGGQLTKSFLSQKLSDHVEAVDANMVNTPSCL